MEAKEQAKRFLEEIKSSDKIGIVFHDDVDGLSSGVLLYDFLNKKGCSVKYWIFSYGKTNKDALFHEFSDRNKVIFADIAPSGILNELGDAPFSDKKCLSIDHHKRIKLPDNFIDYFSQGYMPASRLVYELVGGKSWLALAGVTADAGDKYPENLEFVSEILKENNLGDVKTFRNEYCSKFEELLIYFDENLYEAFNRLVKMKSLDQVNLFGDLIENIDREIKEYYSKWNQEKEILGEVLFYYFNPMFSIRTYLINRVSMENPGEIIIFASLNSSGKIDVSARNQSRKVDVAVLLQKAIEGMEGANAGGHVGAAGGFFKKEDLEDFKERLKKMRF